MNRQGRIPLSAEDREPTALRFRQNRPAGLRHTDPAASALHTAATHGAALACHPVAIMREAGEPYEGPYTVTPSEETQVLETAGLTCRSNITVLPIPTNYGRIAWNGSVLTVT